MVSHHPVNSGSRRHCGNGDMFLFVEEEDSRCCRFNLPLLFVSKKTWIENTAYHNNFYSVHTLKVTIGEKYRSGQIARSMPIGYAWARTLCFVNKEKNYISKFGLE